MGTLVNMAPEVINKSTEGYDEKIDIWALGILLYKMYSGK